MSEDKKLRLNFIRDRLARGAYRAVMARQDIEWLLEQLHESERDREIFDPAAMPPGSIVHVPPGQMRPTFTLRDRFAGQAMAGDCACPLPDGVEGLTNDERARWAYKQADAMLKAREASDGE